ncbi:MAG: hypothetical protein AAF732_17135 [Pseudomonadota bacterium]
MLQGKMACLDAINKQRQAQPDRQISFTDPDSRSMATRGRKSSVVGCNVLAAVDTKNYRIVVQEVTTSGPDRLHLATMSKLTKGVLGVEELEAVADRCCFNSEQILDCSQASLKATLLKLQTFRSKSNGQLVKADFNHVRS